MPARHAEHDASRYPAQVRSITWHLLADGYAVTWAPAPAGCSLDRRGPGGEHAAYRGAGPTMQRAWDEVRAQLGHGQPQPAGGITREAPGPARGSDRLYRVVQYYDSWPFHHDSRIPHGSKSRRRTDTFRTLGPVRRPARASQRPRPVPAPQRPTHVQSPAALLRVTQDEHGGVTHDEHARSDIPGA